MTIMMILILPMVNNDNRMITMTLIIFQLQTQIHLCTPVQVHAGEQGVSALHLAANQGHLQATQLLVENGAKLNEKDSDGDTPIMAGM